MVWLRRSPHCRPSSLSFRCRPSLVPGFLYHIEQARADSTITRRQFGRSTPTPVSGPTPTGALRHVPVLTADIATQPRSAPPLLAVLRFNVRHGAVWCGSPAHRTASQKLRRSPADPSRLDTNSTDVPRSRGGQEHLIERAHGVRAVSL